MNAVDLRMVILRYIFKMAHTASSALSERLLSASAGNLDTAVQRT
jgi:hypothetical protein